jgi:uncharacterized protein (DUF1684 family)
MKKLLFAFTTLLLMHWANAQDKEYVQSIEQWHQKRIEALKTPNGWLNLEGLFWLQKGKNSFGNDKTAHCYYANKDFPTWIGNFIYQGDSVQWENGNVNELTIDKVKAGAGKTYTVFNSEGNASVMDWKTFSWVVIKREDKVGIRFRNLNANTLIHFKGIERFPINPNWRIKAKLIPPTQDFLMISNIIGQTVSSKNAGKLIFEKNGISYSLDVIDEGGKNLFIVFADETSGKSTYGAGRFIEIPKPDQDGNTVIDFNIAYNPPCAFTAYATCPLPPKQNRLALLIEAGEKNYGHH